MVEVGDIEADELGDAHTGRVERLDDGQVAYGQGIPVRGEVRGGLEELCGLLGRQDPGESVVDAGGAQARGDVGGEQPFLEGPGGEGSHRGGAAGQGGARSPVSGLCGKPVAQVRQIEGGQGRLNGLGIALTDTEKAQQVTHIDEVGPHGVLGEVSLQGQVTPVGGEEVGACPRHKSPPDNGSLGSMARRMTMGVRRHTAPLESC